MSCLAAPTPDTQQSGPATAPRPPAQAGNGSGPDPRAGSEPDRQHLRLDRRAHQMRTRMRPRGPVGQVRQTTIGGIAAQPLVHRLPADPVPACHVGDRSARPTPPARPDSAAPPRPAPPTSPAPSTALQATKEPAQTSGNQRQSQPGTRPCRPVTGTASPNRQPGGGTNVSSIYRARTMDSRGQLADCGLLARRLLLGPRRPK